jgi:hypothetical protein
MSRSRGVLTVTTPFYKLQLRSHPMSHEVFKPNREGRQERSDIYLRNFRSSSKLTGTAHSDEESTLSWLYCTDGERCAASAEKESKAAAELSQLTHQPSRVQACEVVLTRAAIRRLFTLARFSQA